MMKVSADNAASHHKAPAKPAPSENPCKPDVACQAATSMIAPPLAEGAVQLTSTVVELASIEALPTSSRPPDRDLRPPIQL